MSPTSNFQDSEDEAPDQQKLASLKPIELSDLLFLNS